MTSIELTISDERLLPQLKKACLLLKGVTSVKVTSEESLDVIKTAGYREAMEDIEKGRITHYDSLKSFFKEMDVI